MDTLTEAMVTPTMTRGYIEQLFYHWSEKLYLTHWTFQFKWDDALDEPDMEAQVDRSGFYDYVNIRIHPDFHKWDQQYANKTVVHELYHLLFRDMDSCVDSVETFLPKKLWEMWELRYEHEVEGLVDRLATITVDLAGCF